MSTYRQKCARQLCGQLKSSQNRQIRYRLAINKVCYSNFVSSYQDKNNAMIAFSKENVFPPTGKNVSDSLVDISNQMKIIIYMAINKVCYPYCVSSYQKKYFLEKYGLHYIICFVLYAPIDDGQ